MWFLCSQKITQEYSLYNLLFWEQFLQTYKYFSFFYSDIFYTIQNSDNITSLETHEQGCWEGREWLQWPKFIIYVTILNFNICCVVLYTYRNKKDPISGDFQFSGHPNAALKGCILIVMLILVHVLNLLHLTRSFVKKSTLVLKLVLIQILNSKKFTNIRSRM